ncbi:hypothetical protein AYO41_04975 [Verrucomicrobia bacterium SCGC AG-212-E04]|nr:hypothetical protein AYO41_04975 [Verrucomicrobia bacterium SCGC AG-212-E04]
MLWTPNQQFHPWPFDKEADLEAAIAVVSGTLFGPHRIYLSVKKIVGTKGKTKNIPDGYLIDLASKNLGDRGQDKIHDIQKQTCARPLNFLALARGCRRIHREQGGRV